jgi:FtsP/CotA-like multicopper oxidase with cupredoxin domain
MTAPRFCSRLQEERPQMSLKLPAMDRRSLLVGTASVAVAAVLPRDARAGLPAQQLALVAAPGRLPIVGAPYPDTDVWCYSGQVPGPEIRVRQGDRVRILVENRLPEDTTVHWHGLRVPNAMDGAPDVTQPSIQPGGSFTYEFAVPDAGTYWYHPHAHSAEQVGRGLAGAFIVEERTPLLVDRDIVWVLGDWRLKRDAAIAEDFNNPMEMSMSGRVGNTVTISGRVPTRFPVRSGERIRLRLINAAPARIFGLEFKDHHPWVIALDGQPIEPHAPDDGHVVLGPAMRSDLIIDMTGAAGSSASVIDTFYQDLAYKLVQFTYGDEPPLATRSAGAPLTLPANTMPEPDLGRAIRHEVTLTGGMMGGMGMGGGGMMGGGMGGMMGHGVMWAINGVAAHGHSMKPILALDRGKSYVFAMDNRTAWYHPMHLHGHSFRVITRNDAPTRYREWRDTVLLAPRQRAEVAFVADNPGDWMFHCHILEHQESGMMGVVRVA